MSDWINNHHEPNSPVNLDLIYTIGGARVYTPQVVANIESGKEGCAKNFKLYFFAATATAEDESVQVWTFATHNEYLDTYHRVMVHIGAPLL